MEDITINQLLKYYAIYKSYIVDNNLEDDSMHISISDLIDFVENHIQEEEEII